MSRALSPCGTGSVIPPRTHRRPKDTSSGLGIHHPGPGRVRLPPRAGIQRRLVHCGSVACQSASQAASRRRPAERSARRSQPATPDHEALDQPAQPKPARPKPLEPPPEAFAGGARHVRLLPLASAPTADILKQPKPSSCQASVAIARYGVRVPGLLPRGWCSTVVSEEGKNTLWWPSRQRTR
jgi:hypothetical protein